MARARWRKAHVGLGGNVGDRRKSLARALRLLQTHPGLRLRKVSSLYETSPVGPRQRPFFNAAAEIDTILSPLELLSFLKRVEKLAGRRKTRRWGPRILDLDLLTYGRLRLRGRALTLPHPELARRKFVLVPLAEIAPRLRAPGLNRTAARLKSELTDPSQKVKLIKGKLPFPNP